MISLGLDATRYEQIVILYWDSEYAVTRDIK